MSLADRLVRLVHAETFSQVQKRLATCRSIKVRSELGQEVVLRDPAKVKAVTQGLRPRIRRQALGDELAHGVTVLLASPDGEFRIRSLRPGEWHCGADMPLGCWYLQSSNWVHTYFLTMLGPFAPQ